jgi:hypothetical protein
MSLSIREFLKQFPEQLREENIIPILDRDWDRKAKKYVPKDKLPGYKWLKYREDLPADNFLIDNPDNKGDHFAVMTGNPPAIKRKEPLFLVVLDIDNDVFFKYFSDVETFTVRTPKGGYHLYFYSEVDARNKGSLFKIPIDVRGTGGYVLIPPSSYEIDEELKPYEVVKDIEIKKVKDFMDYIKRRIPASLRNLPEKDNKKKGDIKEIKRILHYEKGIGLEEVITKDFEEEGNWYPLDQIAERGDIIRMMNPLKKQESGNPSFIVLKDKSGKRGEDRWYSFSTEEGGDVFDYFKESRDWSIQETSKYLSNEYGTPELGGFQGTGKKAPLPSIEDFIGTSEDDHLFIESGMGDHKELGLYYLTEDLKQGRALYGVCKDKYIMAILEQDYRGQELPEGLFICKGFTAPLEGETINHIKNKAREIHSKRVISSNKISEAYINLLKAMQKYIDMDLVELKLICLWIIGSYLRILFKWYPYLTFYGLRDVGKSTVLEFLSRTSFNGSGDVGGTPTEAFLHRQAHATKGFMTIDHYEETRKAEAKKQYILEYLEGAWKLGGRVAKINENTGEPIFYNVASSVAIGTRYIDNSLEEKGILLEMVETTNKNLRKLSATMHKDPFFLEIQGDLMAVALNYQDLVKKAVESEGVDDKLTGRDWNKFLPFLSLARVIDSEYSQNPSLYYEIKNLAIKKKEERKGELKDLEEILLKLIVDEDIKTTTYQGLAGKMIDLGYDNYKWQTARAELDKLKIIKKVSKDRSPAEITLDLERAKARANQRGIPLEGDKPPEPEKVRETAEVTKVKISEIMENKTYEEIYIIDLTLEDITGFYDIFIENHGSIGVISLLETYQRRTGYPLEKVVGIYRYLKDEDVFKTTGNHLETTDKLMELIKVKEQDKGGV